MAVLAVDLKYHISLWAGLAALRRPGSTRKCDGNLGILLKWRVESLQSVVRRSLCAPSSPPGGGDSSPSSPIYLEILCYFSGMDSESRRNRPCVLRKYLWYRRRNEVYSTDDLMGRFPAHKLKSNNRTPDVQHRRSERFGHGTIGIVNNFLTAVRAPIGLGGTGGASP